MYSPPQKIEPPPEKNLTYHPLENLEHPDKKLNSAFPLQKNSNLQDKRHFQQPRKVSTIMKKLHLKNSQSLQKPLTTSEKFSTPLK